MAVDSYDATTGRPIFLDTGAPDTGVDPTAAGIYAADVGNRIVRANLAGLDAYPYERAGLAGHALDTDTDYVHDGSGWLRIQRVHAFSAGSAAIAASGITTVPLPAGRFSVPPVIVATVIGHPNVCVVHYGSRTTTGFDVRVYTLGGGQVAADIHWTAVQMLSGAAAG
ncbi:hypothetical protein [Microbacterium sp. LWH12-1.2]|uniref:hypothetical protein n=1 Tax=Microbacterium sp. LWH12-1.2 TaxID=3135259 RepID=UPI003432FB15